MAKCMTCGGKHEVVQGQCASCRELAEDSSDETIQSVWEEAGKKLATPYPEEEFEYWS